VCGGLFSFSKCLGRQVYYVLSVPTHSYFLFLHKVRVALFEKQQDEEENVSDEKDAKGFTRPRNRTTLIESKFLVY